MIKTTLRQASPHVASLWHPTKNADKTPDNISHRSSFKAQWIGAECGHEWDNHVYLTLDSEGKCLVCSGARIACGFNDLACLFPLLEQQWDDELNAVSAHSIGTGDSKTKYYWKCEQNHSWQATVYSRVNNDQGCFACIKSLAALYPLAAANWDYENNEDLTPLSIPPHYKKDVFWKHAVCGHSWTGQPTNYLSGKCPFCEGRKVLAGFNDLATMRPDLALEWSSENDRDITTISAQSGYMAKWICHVDNRHKWPATVASRVAGNGCGICSGRVLVPGVNDLATVRPDTAALWHPKANGDRLPSQFTQFSNEEITWLGTCGHEWVSPISRRSKSKGTVCFDCSYTPERHNSQRRPESLDKSFAFTHPQMAQQWHSTLNGEHKPEEYKSGSTLRVIWQCTTVAEHTWSAKICDRTTYKTDCPKCHTSAPEKDLVETLLSHGVTLSTSEKSVISPYELDIYLSEQEIAVELNGVYWHSERHRDKTYHHRKWKKCAEKGIQLLQIWEDDWEHRREIVLSSLLQKIGISQSAKVYARDTYIKVISTKDAQNFLTKTHIQGYVSAKYHLGIFDKKENRIVGCMSIRRQGTDGVIVRYATSLQVIGGFTKVISYIKKNFEFSSLITFSDNCISNGGLYENNGFAKDAEILPDYMYVVNNKRQHKFGYRKERFRKDENLQYDESMTESELADLNKIQRIWDAGKIRWKLQLSDKYSNNTANNNEPSKEKNT